MTEIKHPFLESFDVEKIAKAFLAEHWVRGTVPVDIEMIVEIDLRIEIIPEYDLQSRFGVDGLIAPDMRTIYVDRRVYDRSRNRYRFTLAHELGHRILHADSFQSLDITSIDEWRSFYVSLSDREHGWFETQAYWFAGAVLMPETHVLCKFDEAVYELDRQGINIGKLSMQSRSYVAGSIAKAFQVSTLTAEKRIRGLGLW